MEAFVGTESSQECHDCGYKDDDGPPIIFHPKKINRGLCARTAVAVAFSVARAAVKFAVGRRRAKVLPGPGVVVAAAAR